MSESVSESVSDKGTYRAVRGQLKIDQMICCIVYDYATSLHYIMGETISLGSSKVLKSKGLFLLNFVQNVIIPVLTGNNIIIIINQIYYET